ncbi:MAG: hypothetical protein WCW87_00155 [Candidatus Paceibacterota bacterium]
MNIEQIYQKSDSLNLQEESLKSGILGIQKERNDLNEEVKQMLRNGESTGDKVLDIVIKRFGLEKSKDYRKRFSILQKTIADHQDEYVLIIETSGYRDVRQYSAIISEAENKMYRGIRRLPQVYYYLGIISGEEIFYENNCPEHTYEANELLQIPTLAHIAKSTTTDYTKLEGCIRSKHSATKRLMAITQGEVNETGTIFSLGEDSQKVIFVIGNPSLNEFFAQKTQEASMAKQNFDHMMPLLKK